MKEKNEPVVEIARGTQIVVVEMVISVNDLEALIADSGTVSMSVDDDGRVKVSRIPDTRPKRQAGVGMTNELLEALDDARDWIDCCGAHSGLQDILDKIDAAIAKARGERRDTRTKQ